MSRYVSFRSAGCKNSDDPNIVWDCATPIESYNAETAFSPVANLYFYEGSNGVSEAPFHSTAGYYVGGEPESINYAFVIHDDVTPFGTGEYLGKWEIVQVVSGTGTVTCNYGVEGEWLELFRLNIYVEDLVADGTPEEVILDVTVATNNGAGAPVAGSEVTKRVTLKAERLPA